MLIGGRSAPMPPEFGPALRDRRRAAGLSQRELATRIGLDFSYISKVEKRTRAAPRRRYHRGHLSGPAGAARGLARPDAEDPVRGAADGEQQSGGATVLARGAAD